MASTEDQTLWVPETRLTSADVRFHCWGGAGPVGFQNSAVAVDLRFQAARSYSLVSPPSTGRRLIRRSRSGAG